MAFTNGSKNTTTLVNQTKNLHGKTWDEATETLDEAEEETWDVQFLNQSKNTTGLSNQAKN